MILQVGVISKQSQFCLFLNFDFNGREAFICYVWFGFINVGRMATYLIYVLNVGNVLLKSLDTYADYHHSNACISACS